MVVKSKSIGTIFRLAWVTALIFIAAALSDAPFLSDSPFIRLLEINLIMLGLGAFIYGVFSGFRAAFR